MASRVQIISDKIIKINITSPHGKSETDYRYIKIEKIQFVSQPASKPIYTDEVTGKRYWAFSIWIGGGLNVIYSESEQETISDFQTVLKLIS